MTQISILGCGWLGLPLAKSLIHKGFQIKGSTTTEAKIPALEAAGIIPFKIALGQKNEAKELSVFLEGSSILIINIPPKLRSGSGELFTDKIKQLLPAIEESGITKIIFVSSTSVYAETDSVFTEESNTNPTTESGKQLLETEQLLQRKTNFSTTVLRFGGLIGNDRHPVFMLSGRDSIANPLAPVNLIHQTDCINMIESVINHSICNEVFNGVAPCLLTKKEYYTQKAAMLQLPPPLFDEATPSIKKRVDGSKATRLLGINYANV